jgi:phage-related baseplate assembly protein
MSKLQIKPGQRVVVLGRPADVQLEFEPGGDAESADAASAEAVLVFVTAAADLLGADAEAALAAARRDALAWVAYPKAGKLGTDLNRDTLAAALAERGVRPVRQIAIDDTWSALRFRP